MMENKRDYEKWGVLMLCIVTIIYNYLAIKSITWFTFIEVPVFVSISMFILYLTSVIYKLIFKKDCIHEKGVNRILLLSITYGLITQYTIVGGDKFSWVLFIGRSGFIFFSFLISKRIKEMKGYNAIHAKGEKNG